MFDIFERIFAGHETPIFIVFGRPTRIGVQLSSFEMTEKGFNYAPVSIYIYIYVCVANGISQRCACVKLSAKKGTAMFWGRCSPPWKGIARYGVSQRQYRNIARSWTTKISPPEWNFQAIRERPPGLIQHVLTALIFWSWMLLLPQLPPSSRSLRLFPLGHTPSTAGTSRKKFGENSGKTPETLSKRFLEFSSRVRLGCPKPYNSRHLRLPERFQNSLPPSTAGDASFFQNWFRRGPLRAVVMEFPAVLGGFLTPARLG